MDFPFFPFYVKDFLADANVASMTTEEVGAYCLLLSYAWQNKPPGSLPSDDTLLARYVRLPADRWAACRSAVLACFTLGGDGRWHQKRMREEHRKLMDKRKKRVDAGSLGGRTRASNAQAMLDQCLSEGQVSGSGSGSDSSEKEGGLGEGRAPPPKFENSPAGLAQEFVFYQVPRRDDEYKVAMAIEEMVKEGVSLARIADAIRGRKSKRMWFWQLEKQIEAGDVKPLNKTTDEVRADIESQRAERKRRANA